MPTWGLPGITIPASAPPTPASNEPARVVTLPFSYSAVSSPRYQTLPSASCANQSSVISTASPPSVTVSPDEDSLDAVGDRLGLVGYLDNDPLVRLAVSRFSVDPATADGQRHVRVVDLGRELGRVELRRLGALGKAG